MKREHIVLILFAIAVIKSLIFSHIGLNLMFDDNQNYLNGYLINSGERIYSDFDSFFPPFADYHISFILKFTKNILAVRYIHSFIFAFLPPLLFIISRYISKNNFISFITSLFIIFGPIRPDKYFLFTPLLGSFLLGLSALRKKGSNFRLLISGIIFSITLLFRYDLTFYYLFSLILVVLLDEMYRNNFKLSGSLTKLVKRTSLIIIPILITVLCVALWASRNGNITQMIDQTVLTAVSSNYQNKINLIKPNNLFNLNLSAREFNTMFEGWLYIFVFSSFFFAVTHLVRKFNIALSENKTILGLLIIFTLAIPYTLPRMDTGHLFKGGLVFAPLISYNYSKLRRFRYKNVITICCLIFLLGLLTRSYVYLRASSQIIDFKDKGYLLLPSDNSLMSDNKVSAQIYQSSIDFLMMDDKDYVFVHPYMSSLYYFSNKKPPIIYSNLLNGYINEIYNEEYVITSLESKKVDTVVYDPTGGPNSDLGGASKIYSEIDNYIFDNFDIVNNKKNGWLFMKRIKVIAPEN